MENVERQKHSNSLKKGLCRRAGVLFLGLFTLVLLSFLVAFEHGEKEQEKLVNTSSSIHEIAEKVLSLLSKNDFEG